MSSAIVASGSSKVAYRRFLKDEVSVTFCILKKDLMLSRSRRELRQFILELRKSLRLYEIIIEPRLE